MAKLERILIVSGGIAGLTVAVALRQRGFDPKLVERETAWSAVGAGIAATRRCFRPLESSASGRKVRLQGSLREGLESAPRPSFHCEREIGFTARSGPSVLAHLPHDRDAKLDFEISLALTRVALDRVGRSRLDRPIVAQTCPWQTIVRAPPATPPRLRFPGSWGVGEKPSSARARTA
jgi:hypothetical protein